MSVSLPSLGLLPFLLSSQAPVASRPAEAQFTIGLQMGPSPYRRTPGLPLKALHHKDSRLMTYPTYTPTPLQVVARTLDPKPWYR